MYTAEYDAPSGWKQDRQCRMGHNRNRKNAHKQKQECAFFLWFRFHMSGFYHIFAYGFSAEKFII